jgi:alpha-N-arabinofuranosidase
MKISFDEWNVWYQQRFGGESSLEWAQERPLIEDEYSVLDAIVVGSYLISLLSHADRVAVACQAQLVNVIAPIRTLPGGPSWRQTIYHPFAQAARLARGNALRVEPVSPMIETAAHGAVPAVHATATHDEESGQVALFAVNRDRREHIELRADVRALGPIQLTEHQILSDADLGATNNASHPDRVVPRPATSAAIESGILTLRLPPASWNVVRLSASHGR